MGVRAHGLSVTDTISTLLLPSRENLNFLHTTKTFMLMLLLCTSRITLTSLGCHSYHLEMSKNDEKIND